MPTDARHVVVAVNPKAGATDAEGRVARLTRFLEECGLETNVLSDLDEVAAKSNRLHEEGQLRALVGVGGDGTAAGRLGELRRADRDG